MESFHDFGIIDGDCKNFTIDHFNTLFSINNKRLMVLNFNIQCYDAKIDEFSAFIDKLKLKPEILVLTETWFSPMTCKEIPGYNAYHCTRPGVHDRGGVSIYVLKNLDLYLTHYSSNVSAELEHVHITLKHKNSNMKNIDIVGIYRPPHRALVGEFLVSFESKDHL